MIKNSFNDTHCQCNADDVQTKLPTSIITEGLGPSVNKFGPLGLLVLLYEKLGYITLCTVFYVDVISPHFSWRGQRWIKIYSQFLSLEKDVNRMKIIIMKYGPFLGSYIFIISFISLFYSLQLAIINYKNLNQFNMFSKRIFRMN